ncbi:GNAT family N-acetyltransferase [Saccharomonospora sp. NPDC006951]
MRPYVFTEPITTPRLRLRLMDIADVDDIHAYQSREDVCAHLLYSPRTRDEVVAKVTGFATRTRLEHTGDVLQLAVERAEDKRVLGEVCVTIRSEENATADIGWVFHPAFHGRGYASEAALALLDLTFGTLGLHRVIAELSPANTASVKLCRRIGMREEAHFVQDVLVKGRWEDTGVYAILHGEWLAGEGKPNRRG